MEWVQITTAGILSHLPTDVLSRYTAWIAQYPDRANRLAEITANTIREFRDAIKSVPANTWHSDETYLPQSAVRHCENIIVFTLGMEMGMPIDTSGNSAVTNANIYLRQIPMGRLKTVDEGETGQGSPSYAVPTDRGTRALPALALAVLLLASRAMGGWIAPDAVIADTAVATTFTPSAYGITAQSLFYHLQGINSALAATATQAWVTNIVAGISLTNTTDQEARNLASAASVTANAAIGALAGYTTTANLTNNYIRFSSYNPSTYPFNEDGSIVMGPFTNFWTFAPGRGVVTLAYHGGDNWGTPVVRSLDFQSGAIRGNWISYENYSFSGDITFSNAAATSLSTFISNAVGEIGGISAAEAGQIATNVASGYLRPPDAIQTASIAALADGVATIDLGSNWCWRLDASGDITAINFSTAGLKEGAMNANSVKGILLEVSRGSSGAWAWGGHLSHITNTAPPADAVSHLLLIGPSQDVTGTNGWAVY